MKRIHILYDSKEQEFQFYKNFYKENRVKLLFYDNLRYWFEKMISEVLGEDYYNEGMDVYTCDRISCVDMTRKTKKWYNRIFE